MPTDPKRIQRKLEKKKRIVRVAAGLEKADVVLKNAKYLNVFSNELCSGDIAVAEGLIAGIGEYSGAIEYDMANSIVLPGFIDSHIHLESALVSPAEFARAVIPHGTTTVIADPHEIANVMGAKGLDYMFAACEQLPLDVHSMLPSCVPATPEDESGCTLSWQALDPYFDHPKVLGLAEMMDFPGVTGAMDTPIEKIVLAQSHHKKIDCHAPGLTGQALNAYIAAGVYSDHECSDLSGALEKLRLGQFIMIREGTAAHNLRALHPLIDRQHMDRCMFCSDDKHPDALVTAGHIDDIIRSSIAMGADPIAAAKVGTHSAARYFLLNNKGAIAPGYLADFAVIDDFRSFAIQKVFKRGKIVFDGKPVPFPDPEIPAALAEAARDTVHIQPVSPETFASSRPLPVIGMIPGEILSENLGFADSIDADADRVKIALIERHHATGHVGLAYLSGYGLKSGAIATSVSHDSHNIIAVGANESDMAFAVKRIQAMHGGIAVVENGAVRAEVPLPIAGLISDQNLQTVYQQLEDAKAAAHRLGVTRTVDPFMTLSFMALTVIPELRITTRGAFSVSKQKYMEASES